MVLAVRITGVVGLVVVTALLDLVVLGKRMVLAVVVAQWKDGDAVLAIEIMAVAVVAVALYVLFGQLLDGLHGHSHQQILAIYKNLG